MKILAFILLVVFVVAGDASAQTGIKTSCDQLRGKVPNLGHLLRMTNAERAGLKQFVIAHETELKACLGDRVERLKSFLK